jgi:hypothetical protein
MEYEQLKQSLQKELPINRKERFYTGTVLPSILFHNGLSNLFRFLREIEGFPGDINENTTQDNFLFYTEYNLKESAGKKSVGAEIYTATRDAPDIVIEILKPRKVFVVIEAKMFANLTQNNFGKQIAAQKLAVIDILKNKYALDDTQVFHVALTPKSLGFETTVGYQLINWEFFLANDEIDLRDNYFANFLRFALEHYDELVCDQPGMASTVERQIPGFDVYLNGTGQEKLWVGRKGGKRTIEDDVKKGVWRDKLYAINTQKPQDGQKGNWINSHEFAAIVDNATKGFPVIPGRWYACEIMGDFFKNWEDRRSYSPIRIDGIEPSAIEDGIFLLRVYHANYPEGVRDKVYKLKVLERGDSYMIAKSLDHTPARILQVYDIDAAWISRHFPEVEVIIDDVQEWLNTHS